MRTLAEIQTEIANAVVSGRPGAGMRLGGGSSGARLAIHVRHYAHSLTAALRSKYPATAWLLGAEAFHAAALGYVRSHPPERPCIAEYGADFCTFIAAHVAAQGSVRELAWLRSFVKLEWLVGKVSIAVEEPRLEWPEIARLGPSRLLDAAVSMQSGIGYVRSAWQVDLPLKDYLAGAEREPAPPPAGSTRLEVRGARGSLWLTRLDAAAFAFRSSLHSGAPLGAAAERALECDEAFDAGAALRDVVRAGLVVGFGAGTIGDYA